MHSCAEGLDKCPCEKNAEGHSICCVTGFCVKMLNFSDCEFVDTVNYVEQDRQTMIQHVPPAGVTHHTSSSAALHSSSSKTSCNPPVDPAIKYTHHHAPPMLITTSSPAKGREHTTGSETMNVPRCSVNKKNRYRSWVHHRMQASWLCSIFMQEFHLDVA